MRRKGQKRTQSLTWQMAVIIIGHVAGTVFLCWFLNNTFLERYYIAHKQNSMLEGYESIDDAATKGILEKQEYDVTFENLCANGNITVLIIGPDRTIVRSSANDNQGIMIQFMDLIFDGGNAKTTTLEKSDNYVLQKQTDERLNSEYLVLWGTLSDGNFYHDENRTRKHS